jgi:hypothetical protein
VAAFAVAGVAMCAIGCGKKGPPLAPFVLIPGPVQTITTSRLGDDVFVTLTVPLTNVDESIPVDIGRVDVYGYTGSVAPTPARWGELGDLVARIPVVMPPVGGDGVPPSPVGVLPEGALPGSPVTILDTLEPDELVQGPVAVADPQRLEFAPLSVPGATLPTVLRRFYVAIPFSRRERAGPPGTPAGLVLTGLPDRPSEVRAEFTSAALSLAWEPSGGLLGFLLDRPLAAEPLPFDAVASPTTVPIEAVDASVPPGPTTYNVYRTMAPDPRALPLALPPAPAPSLGQVPQPMSLNPAPLATTSTTDDVAFGRPRCYAVRAQRGAVMSELSQPTCLTPIDVFPPAAPVGIAAVPSEGGISLIWEPSTEIDLGGYLVLRQEAGDATLRQLTDLPISDVRYRDTSVQPGTRYTYSVVAVDTQLPLPNTSTQSAPVEETSR